MPSTPAGNTMSTTSEELDLHAETTNLNEADDIPSCRYCWHSYYAVADFSELCHGLEQGCLTCQVLLDAFETWNEYNNLPLQDYLNWSRPEKDKMLEQPFLTVPTSIPLVFRDAFLGLFRNPGRFRPQR